METKVSNLRNSNGNTAANQFVIETGKSKIFQSYSTVICEIKGGKVYLDEKFWNYSHTTSKYRNIFLNEDKKTTEQKIKSGVYVLTNLN